MKITEIETIPLRLPFAHTFTISQGAGREFIDTLIVRVHTDQGIVGIGETQAWRRQGSAETIWNLVRTIKDHLSIVEVAPVSTTSSALGPPLTDAAISTMFSTT